MEISGRASAVWYYVQLGVLWWTNVLSSALPPQRLRPDTWLEHQDPVSHTAAVWLQVKDSTSVPLSSPLSTLYWLFLKSFSSFDLLFYLQFHRRWQKFLYLWCRLIDVVTSGSLGPGLGCARWRTDVHGELGPPSCSARFPSPLLLACWWCWKAGVQHLSNPQSPDPSLRTLAGRGPLTLLLLLLSMSQNLILKWLSLLQRLVISSKITTNALAV